MKLSEYIKEDRPREKLESLGVKNLTDSELLSIIIRTGNKNESVNELSSRILKEVKGLNNLSDMSLNELMKIHGIGLSKASEILSAFEIGFRVMNYHKDKIKLRDSKEIFNYYKNEFVNAKEERFYAIYFDIRNNLIKKEELFKGTIDQVTVHFREIFKIAIKESAKYIVVMHNHPSCDVRPSDEDVKLTRELQAYGEFLDIKVIDHIIISSDSYFSFYEYYSKKKHKNK